MKAFAPRLGTQQWCSLSTLLFNIILEVPARAIRQDKEIKSIEIRKEEVKLSLFPDDAVLHIENPRLSQKTVRKKSTNSVKLQNIKLTYRNQLFLYYNNKTSKIERILCHKQQNQKQ